MAVRAKISLKKGFVDPWSYPNPSLPLGQVLTLDNSQYSVGAVQGDGQS